MKVFMKDVAKTCCQMIVMAAVFSVLFILLSFFVHGHVDLW